MFRGQWELLEQPRFEGASSMRADAFVRINSLVIPEVFVSAALWLSWKEAEEADQAKAIATH